MFKKLISAMAVFMVVLALPGLSACNTVQGIGKDIEKSGEALQRAANRNKDKE